MFFSNKDLIAPGSQPLSKSPLGYSVRQLVTAFKLGTLSLLIPCLFAGSSALASDDYATIAPLLATCVTCHGRDGLAVSPAWPHLAGQKVTYLANELQAFREGSRQAILMPASGLTGLSDADIQALAEYYAKLPPVRQKSTHKVNERGKNVRAYCLACHGVEGKTVNQKWPNLAGQNKEYLKNQLIAFRDGSRQGFWMNLITQELSDQQISDVADYYSQIEP